MDAYAQEGEVFAGKEGPGAFVEAELADDGLGIAVV
jgi:hypothetical protein